MCCEPLILKKGGDLKNISIIVEICYDIFASKFCIFGISSHKFLAPPL